MRLNSPRAQIEAWIVAEILVFLALVSLLLGPFLLRPQESNMASADGRRLVILTPHNERVRTEFGLAFREFWRERTGKSVYIDWRTPGGASELAMLVRSEFTNAMGYYWTHVLQRPWHDDLLKGFASARPSEVPGIPVQGSDAKSPRGEFLNSDVGIGVDLLFGGGAYDFQQYAKAGFLVSSTPDSRYGLTSVINAHPDWFDEAVMPKNFNGENFRDDYNRWAGVVLASFGIVYNRDVLQKLGLNESLMSWAILARPELLNQVALSDPTKSGSVAKAFELLVHQQIALAAGDSENANTAGETIGRERLREGWRKGLQLIQDISGNARYFTDSASKIALEVARGEAAAGMSIDSYGRAMEFQLEDRQGRTRVGFTMPHGGSSVSVDPIGMLRGAPSPDLATAFMEFVLSIQGQKLWALQPGQPGGPRNKALLRLPLRRDFYTKENLVGRLASIDPPYERGQTLYYHREWTGGTLAALRFIIRVMCIDTHWELHRAWQAMARSGFPPEATAIFHTLDGVEYDDALGEISSVLNAKDKIQEVSLARRLGDRFRAQYEEAHNKALVAAVPR